MSLSVAVHQQAVGQRELPAPGQVESTEVETQLEADPAAGLSRKGWQAAYLKIKNIKILFFAALHRDYSIIYILQHHSYYITSEITDQRCRMKKRLQNELQTKCKHEGGPHHENESPLDKYLRKLASVSQSVISQFLPGSQSEKLSLKVCCVEGVCMCFWTFLLLLCLHGRLAPPT